MGLMIIPAYIFRNRGVTNRPLNDKGRRTVLTASHEIFGTTLFDGDQAQKGYALNKMCFSFNHADNRAAFKANEEAYIERYGLNAQQAQAIRTRDVLGLIAAGGNVYYLAKFAGILGLDVQDLGAAQTGMTKAEFKARLVAQNLQPETL